MASRFASDHLAIARQESKIIAAMAMDAKINVFVVQCVTTILSSFTLLSLRLSFYYDSCNMLASIKIFIKSNCCYLSYVL